MKDCSVYCRVTLSLTDPRLGDGERTNLANELCAGLLMANLLRACWSSGRVAFMLLEVDTTMRHIVVYDSIAGFAEEHGHVDAVVTALSQYANSEWRFQTPPCTQQSDGMYSRK